MVRNHEWNIQEIWDTMKTPNLKIIVNEEGIEIQPKGLNKLFNEIISKNYPKLWNEMENQIGETYRTPNIQKCKRSTPRHIIMKILNIQIK